MLSSFLLVGLKAQGPLPEVSQTSEYNLRLQLDHPLLNTLQARREASAFSRKSTALRRRPKHCRKHRKLSETIATNTTLHLCLCIPISRMLTRCSDTARSNLVHNVRTLSGSSTERFPN